MEERENDGEMILVKERKRDERMKVGVTHFCIFAQASPSACREACSLCSRSCCCLEGWELWVSAGSWPAVLPSTSPPSLGPGAGGGPWPRAHRDSPWSLEAEREG